MPIKAKRNIGSPKKCESFDEHRKTKQHSHTHTQQYHLGRFLPISPFWILCCCCLFTIIRLIFIWNCNNILLYNSSFCYKTSFFPYLTNVGSRQLAHFHQHSCHSNSSLLQNNENETAWRRQLRLSYAVSFEYKLCRNEIGATQTEKKKETLWQWVCRKLDHP